MAGMNIHDWAQYQGNTVDGTTTIQLPAGAHQPFQPPVPQYAWGQLPFNPYQHRPTLTDYDIELMALCIANKHPQIEGEACCFCMKKRLEKGISKD